MATTKTATIADGASLSGAVDLGAPVTVKGVTYDPTLMALVTPSGWDTQAITFQVSADGENYVNLYRVGTDGTATEYKITGAAASVCYTLTPQDFGGFRYLKVRSGTAGAAANQSGAVTLTLIVRDL
jgi:hypothetical protein